MLTVQPYGTNINNRAYGLDGLGNKILQVMWTGARYAITDNLDLMGGYYHISCSGTSLRRGSG